MIDVGSHVVCTNKSWKKLHQESAKHNKKFVVPSNSIVYTVKNVYTSSVNGKRYLRLVEIINPTYPNGFEPGYNIDCFKPLKKINANDYLNIKIPEDA